MNATETKSEAVEQLQVRVHGDPARPALIYLPGLHGDWTLIGSFRAAMEGKVRFVEFTYPRTLEWTIADYAHAVETALLDHGIARGWLLGESFGSQIVWPLVERNDAGGRFKVDGVVLAGGFVKHPWKWGPGLLGKIVGGMTMKSVQTSLEVYVWYSRFRHRHAPEALQGVREFVARRTELDRRAMRHRLRLLDQYDPRSIARRTRVPIHYLAGFVDPIVPWPIIRRWLRENCPAYRGGKTLWRADHNVLATQPDRAAEHVWGWMTAAEP